MMKKKPDFPAGAIAETVAAVFRRLPRFPKLEPVPGIVCLLSFLIAVIVTVSYMDQGDEQVGEQGDFEAGKVAERDVVAAHSFSYVDEYATRLRMEAQEQLVPAVFRVSANISQDVLDSWMEFCGFADRLAAEGSSPAAIRLAVQARYPARFRNETVNAYFSDPARADFDDYGTQVLDTILAKGVFAMGTADLGRYNPDQVELIVTRQDRTVKEIVSYRDIVTLDNIEEAVTLILDEHFPEKFIAIAPALLAPFVRENVYFSHEDTTLQVTMAREQTSAVLKHIEKGSRIIRKGFVITADEMLALRALVTAVPKKDPRSMVGLVLLLAMLYVTFILMQSGRLVSGGALTNSESCLLFSLVCLYLTGAVLAKNLVPALSGFPVSLFFPTALLVMIPAVFIGPLPAFILAMAFPLSACLAGSFDIPSLVFALFSGIAASTVLKNAEKRMDLIKAGLEIAGVNCLVMIVILLMSAADVTMYPTMLFWAAFNGIVSGMLVIGLLPLLEHALNASTTFRLIELSDLNAPILRKLFTTASGTYSHSIMVATLAEQACQDIGANALLARVGGYYHDVGKMDNPDYFVENQTIHNRHDDIAPRLSATVIRSHVKLGVEKARSLGLPADVINIISEHHGNSLIAWFYDKASQQEEQVNTEDFTYPGSPPRSKESAVVMLADVAEAAIRTLTKPTAAKMDKFIQKLIDAKVETGQLAKSELSFRDLETIKNTFVKVLAGYYHSRIEYPKTDSDSNTNSNGKEDAS